MLCSAKRQLKILTIDPQKSAEDGMALIQLSKDEFLRYCKTCYLIIREWNDTHAERFGWQPTLRCQAIDVHGGEHAESEFFIRILLHGIYKFCNVVVRPIESLVVMIRK